MYYSISEVSKQLNVSKVTIYKKIDKIKELKEHVKQLKDGKFITEQGIEIIRNSIQVNQFNRPLQCESSVDSENAEFASDLIAYKQLIKTLESQVSELKEDRLRLYEQLRIKDNQLNSLTDALNISQKLVENGQVLLKQEQNKNNLLIETSEASNQKSFWSMFKRK